MHEAVNVVMRVFMRAWYHDVVESLATTPRASGIPQAHASGLDPDRLLVFGNGLATGWGVATHQLALPGELARALSAATGRGADVDILVYPDEKIAGAYKSLQEHTLSSYDAVVVIVGASDALSLTPRAQWRASMRALIESLLDGTPTSTRVTIVGQSPIRPVPPFNNFFGRLANAHATRLNHITRELCSADPRLEYMTLPSATSPATERLGTPERYKQWGYFLARELAPHLNEQACPAQGAAGTSARGDRNRAQGEEDRYNTLERLHIIGGAPDETIDRIVATARSVFGTQGAAFTLVGKNRQWHKSISGSNVTDLPLELAVCPLTIQSTSPLIIADARKDPRFSPDSPVAFYAGYPIESSDGQRIGALCVFDTRPRDVSIVDPIILRDLALLVQEQVWHYPLAPDGGPHVWETEQ
ncbi:MAG: GAF domain-containing protein [Lacisediminihabitans sp.]